MAKYLMLGKYFSESVKGITPDRTKKVTGIIEKAGGKVESMLAILGRYDLAFIVDYPDNKSVFKAAVEIAKATGIGFASSPAITVEEFDKITG